MRGVDVCPRRWLWFARALLAAGAVTLAGCASNRDELSGLAVRPPLDRAVLVSGGAFFAPAAVGAGTFGAEGARDGEAISFDAIVDTLERGAVFQRLDADGDPARRRALRAALDGREDDPAVRAFLRQAREDGYDLLLLVEQLQDGPIESQGTNSRWPVTFATWILLGVGAFIPDRTFESTAALRLSFRELQSGREVDSVLLVPGPVDLALTERADFLGLLTSAVVPPFWVQDDADAVVRSIRATTRRRLLLSLVRELKSEVRRRRLSEREVAALALEQGPDGPRVVVESQETVSVARLVHEGLPAAAAQAFVDRLLASRALVGGKLRYEAALPREVRGRFQVRVGTLGGEVASSTFRAEGAR
ncbi:MAG: hypothetical protein ACON4Z_17930 [Planctomycetota bacterium]